MKIRLRFFVLELAVIDLSNNKKVNCVLADENQKIVGWEKE